MVVWGHPPELVTEINLTRRHPRLPDVEIDVGVHFTVDPQEAFRAPLWISALPVQVRDVLAKRFEPGPLDAALPAINEQG